MGKIFYIFGKSATGKDTIYQKLITDSDLGLKPIILYTTRPMRESEINGKNYFFVDEERMLEIEKQGKVIEHRVYDTVFGPWHYFMADDGNIDLNKENYLIIGTLESYCNVRKYFGDNAIVPIYVFVEDGTRLSRAIERERIQNSPAYEEVCRRFLADASDFSEDKLMKANIINRFENYDFSKCLEEIKGEIIKFCK